MTHTHPAAGHTLAELLIVMAISTMIFGAILLTTTSTLQAMDHVERRGGVDHGSTYAIHRISMDLATAIRVGILGPQQFSFTVPDITGDAVDDTIEYLWSGVAGESLTRSVNGTALPLVEDVSACTFDYIYSDLDTRGAQPELTIEPVTVAEFLGFPAEAGDVYDPRPDFDLDPGDAIHITFVAKADAEALTELIIQAEVEEPGVDTLAMITDEADGQILASGTLLYAQLPVVAEWLTIPMAWTAPDGRGIRVGQTYGIYLFSATGFNYSASIKYDRIDHWADGVVSWPNQQTFWLFNGFGWWLYGDDFDLLFTVKGTKRRPHGRIDEFTENFLKAVNVAIATGSGEYSTQQRVSVRLLNF